jgi:hypothetical protein
LWLLKHDILGPQRRRIFGESPAELLFVDENKSTRWVEKEVPSRRIGRTADWTADYSSLSARKY